MQQINIDELKPHPRNTEFFDDIDGEKWEELLESIRKRVKENKRGNIEPIIITQDKIIVSGHQRVRAFKELNIPTIEAEIRIYSSEDEVLLDLLESNVRRRGEIGGSVKKVGKRIKELERLYGIRDGSAGGNGSNQYIKKELEPNSSAEAKKSQAELAAQMGMSVDTLQNYKMLADMIPEIDELVSTGIVTKTTALAMMRNLSEKEQIELISSMDTTKKITQKEVKKYINEINQLKSDNKVGYDLENKYNEALSQISDLKTEISNLEVLNQTLKSSKESTESLLQSYKKESQEYIKLKNDIASLNLDPSGDYNIIEISKDITVLVNETEKLLSTTLSPLRYSKILPIVKENDSLRKNLENIIYMVDEWCQTMAETIGVAVDKNIIDMEELN